MSSTETEVTADDGSGRGRRSGGGQRRRRRVVLGAGAVVVLASVGAGALGLGGGDPAPGSTGPARSGSTVRVTRGNLAETTTVDGQLGHGTQIPLPVKATGTVTWLPARGTVVRRGETLLRVDDRPVVLLYGALPMYRGLAVAGSGSQPAPGPTQPAGAKSGGTAPPSTGPAPTGGPGEPLRGLDVMQFESNLSALGYSGFTVDEEYSSLTATAVKRWQKDLDLPQTGTVGVGDVVYAAGPVRIAGTGVRVGAEASGDVLDYTGTSRVVTVDAPVGGAVWAVRGTEVTVVLPDDRTVQGKVTSVGSDAAPAGGPGGGPAAAGGDGSGGADGSGGGDGSGGPDATVPVAITLSDQKALGSLESSPVTVRYVARSRTNVLTVPVSALVALAEGGYGLEVVGSGADGGTSSRAGSGTGNGSSRFVAVKTGLFADGKVEVSGPAVREGMTVRIPE